jgi:hypothetical protein
VRILDRLPYSTEQTTLTVRGEAVRVRPYQIVVWVSVAAADLPDWDPRIPAVPAILDTGNNYNFALFESQLVRWAGVRRESLQPLGMIRVGGRPVPRHDADVWLHANVPGTRERSPTRQPVRLSLADGVAVYADEGQSVPHLPLLGLRALTDNQLHTVIDGARREVTIRTARPWWWPFR